MRFLCDNCKAKYQIADEKVAGRTVRMKCRKCGHLIELAASVTETSTTAHSVATEIGHEVVESLPSEAPPRAGGPPRPAAPPPRPRPVGGVAKPTPTATAAKLTTGTIAKPGPAAPTPKASPLAAVAKPAVAVPKPAGTAPKPAATTGTVPARKTTTGAGGAAEVSSKGGASTGLAGAFSKAVAVAPGDAPSAMSTAVAVLSSANTEEWYVGINGVPVGPVRLGELRRKAQQGFINEESLVWREGFEEWVPLRTFPELCALLKEATATARTSLTPPPSSAASPVRPTSPPKAPTPAPVAAPRAPTPGATPAPTKSPAAAQPARSNVVPIASRRAAPEPAPFDDDAEEPTRLDLSFDTAALGPAPAARPTGFQPANEAKEAAPAPVPQARAAGEGSAPHRPPAPADPSGRASDMDLLAAAPLTPSVVSTRDATEGKAGGKRHRHVPAVAKLVPILVGVLGGMVIMLVIARRPEPQVVMVPVSAAPVIASAPALAPKADKGEPTDDLTTTSIGPIELGGAVAPKAGGALKATTKVDTTPSATPTATASPNSLSNLVTGPAVNAVPAAGGGAAPQLTEAEISRVVMSRRAFVSRRCWEPALGGKAPNTPATAKVTVSLSIAADGHVSDANAAGGDGFPGLAGCVQGQVKTWTFPRNDGQSTIKIPFVFARQ